MTDPDPLQRVRSFVAAAGPGWFAGVIDDLDNAVTINRDDLAAVMASVDRVRALHVGGDCCPEWTADWSGDGCSTLAALAGAS